MVAPTQQATASSEPNRRAIHPMRRILTLVAIATAFVLIASNINGFMGFRWWSWHQKLTVEVLTPSGLKTASSVVEASWEMAPAWFKLGDSGGGHGTGLLKGEAVTLELARNRYLFILLKGYSAETAIQLFGELKTFGRNEYSTTLDRISSSLETIDLPHDKYPLLVTLDDINNPASVKRIDPANLEATFGPGYRLNGITLSLTKEPVTKGNVRKLLLWLGDYPEPPILPKLDPMDFSFKAKLRQGDFIRGQ